MELRVYTFGSYEAVSGYSTNRPRRPSRITCTLYTLKLSEYSQRQSTCKHLPTSAAATNTNPAIMVDQGEVQKDKSASLTSPAALLCQSTASDYA
jgi:hypothetical protein